MNGISLAVSKNMHPAGRQLSEKAKEIAVGFEKTEFKASDGWLDKGKKCFNIKKGAVVGESGCVSCVTLSS